MTPEGLTREGWCTYCRVAVREPHLVVRSVPGSGPDESALATADVGPGIVVHVGATITERLCAACVPRFERAWAVALAGRTDGAHTAAFMRRYATARPYT